MIKKFLINEMLALGAFVPVFFAVILLIFLIFVYGVGAIFQVSDAQGAQYENISWIHCKNMCKCLIEAIFAPFRFMRDGFAELRDDIRNRGASRLFS